MVYGLWYRKQSSWGCSAGIPQAANTAVDAVVCLCYQTPAQPVSWSTALAAVSLRSHKGKAEKEREA